MICLERNEELNAFLDGELTVEQTATLAEHLATCPNCSANLAELARLRQALAQSFPEVEPSAELRARVEALLDAEADVAPADNVVPLRSRVTRRRVTWIGGIAAAAAALAILLSNPKDESRDLMAVRDASLRGDQSQVAVSQPVVPAVPGFTLASARSDIVAGHQARVLVYDGADGKITLCIWAANGEPAHGVRNADYQGTKISYWNDGENEFWAASAQPGPALNSFVHALTAG
jgi:anti-sigma factor RsiW